MADRPVNAIYVGDCNLMRPTGGGVQICNRECISVLSAAGLDLTFVEYDFDRSLLPRVLRRVGLSYKQIRPPKMLAETIQDRIEASGADYVIFAMHAFPEVSRTIRRSMPEVRQILMSHGVEVVDMALAVHLRAMRDGVTPNRRAATRVGSELFQAMDRRVWIDGVVTLSPFELEVERWLGARSCTWLPRTISDALLPLQQVKNRVGCVATLDHPPNAQSLIQLFRRLQPLIPPSFQFRLVGRPERIGKALATRFPFVHYLGPLSDEGLRDEASTWYSFVHPMFFYAKGCSTKLAVGLGWGLPVATTDFGTRGYRWDRSVLPVANSPTELANIILAHCDPDRFIGHRNATLAIVAQSPKTGEVASTLRKFLDSLGRGETD